jgi:hypothetical protein
MCGLAWPSAEEVQACFERRQWLRFALRGLTLCCVCEVAPRLSPAGGPVLSSLSVKTV